MTTVASSTNLATLRSKCSECGDVRNCDIFGDYTEKYGDEDFQGRTQWYILKCRGCDHVFVQTISTDSESYDNYYKEDGSTGTIHFEDIKYWPALPKRKRPEWLHHYGIDAENVHELSIAMRELYIALDNDLSMLSSIGIRTACDIASELLGIDPNFNFQQKLDALVAGGWIGSAEKGQLKTLIDAGSASAHRGWQPSGNDLNILMDVLEHFIHDSFVSPARKATLDQQMANVRRKVPLRSNKAQKSSKN